MQAMMVPFVDSANRLERIGQRKAPAIPEVVAVTERIATATVPMCSSVRAYRIAVPLTVAMESDSRNQASKKALACGNLAAIFTVPQTERQAKEMYANICRERPLVCGISGRGGPGRERSSRVMGMVNDAHSMPTMRRTARMAIVEDDKCNLLSPTSRPMLMSCVVTAAM